MIWLVYTSSTSDHNQNSNRFIPSQHHRPCLVASSTMSALRCPPNLQLITFDHLCLFASLLHPSHPPALPPRSQIHHTISSLPLDSSTVSRYDPSPHSFPIPSTSFLSTIFSSRLLSVCFQTNPHLSMRPKGTCARTRVVFGFKSCLNALWAFIYRVACRYGLGGAECSFHAHFCVPRGTHASDRTLTLLNAVRKLAVCCLLCRFCIAEW